MRPALIVLAVVAVLALGGYSTLKTILLGQLTGVVMVRDGQVEDVVDGKGVIVRRETVLKSPVTGTITLTLEEGTLTRKDAEVANLSDTEERQQAESQIAQLQADLDAFNANNQDEEASLADTLRSTEAEARAKAEELRRACLESDVARISAVQAELEVLAGREEEAAARLDTIRKDRAGIEDALATAKAALQQVVFPILAPEPGLVSYTLDGLEETLTPESIGQYGTKQILTMSRNAAAIADQSRVQAGDPVAKIVGDAEAYVSIIVTNSQADKLAAAREVTLRFPSFTGRRETAATLFHVGEREKNGYCLVTYRTEGLLDGMISSRQTDVSVVAHVWSGSVLPRKAVVHRGGQDGVFVLDVTVCRFQPVEILGESGGEVVVEGLEPGTQVITTPWLVKEGTRIG